MAEINFVSFTDDFYAIFILKSYVKLPENAKFSVLFFRTVTREFSKNNSQREKWRNFAILYLICYKNVSTTKSSFKYIYITK